MLWRGCHRVGSGGGSREIHPHQGVAQRRSCSKPLDDREVAGGAAHVEVGNIMARLCSNLRGYMMWRCQIFKKDYFDDANKHSDGKPEVSCLIHSSTHASFAILVIGDSWYRSCY
jgi:hypothetical protein